MESKEKIINDHKMDMAKVTEVINSYRDKQTKHEEQVTKFMNMMKEKDEKFDKMKDYFLD